VREVNIQTRLRVDEEAWPPEQPKTFTPLLLIQHKGHRNLKQSTAMAKFVEQGHLDKFVSITSSHTVTKRLKLDKHQQEVIDTSKVTKEIAEILALLDKSNDPQFVLFDGAPGIGKSFLLKEIAYCWGERKILHKFKLVLLVCLRDFALQKISLINDLLKLFCKGDRRTTEIANACSDYLLENNGEDIAFLFDGYDEYPQTDGLIADILKRKVLPRCGLIVSSRPHASVSLREQRATVRVEILGFTKAEREHYIKEAMEGQTMKINEVIRYLQDHPTISSLCFVPFNMVVLVYLYKKGIPLPKSSTELYDYFIFQTIYRDLTKRGDHLQSNITKLTDLPEPCYKLVQQLSKLSLEALNDNKLIFTIDEIKAACPDITTIPGAINGFGLLQAVEHFGYAGKTKTFNFLHLSIQEYLAAHYIANLPAKEELRILEDKFWNDVHFNMFSIYITLTKGQRPSFKHFLSGGNPAISISDEFLNYQLPCFRLYHCFREAGDVDMCKTIEQSGTFSNKEINLFLNTSLAASDVECVTVFLTSSFHKEWVKLDLNSCFLQDHGLHILHHGLCHCNDVTINELGLNRNGLTAQSSSLISELTVKYKVKKLGIENNHGIGENKELYSMLTDSNTMLEELYMRDTKLSSGAAITLFTALKHNTKLKLLSISNNDITDDVCDAISTTLKWNSCLVQLHMFSNSLTGEAILNMVNGIAVNNTLKLLRLPKCSEEVKTRITSQQEVINKKRESQGCQVKLVIEYW